MGYGWAGTHVVCACALLYSLLGGGCGRVLLLRPPHRYSYADILYIAAGMRSSGARPKSASAYGEGFDKVCIEQSRVYI